MTKLASKLPDGASNGLIGSDQRLSDDPEALHTVVAIVDVSKITTNVDTGDVEPTIRIRQIQIINGSDGEKAARMLRRAAEAHAGQLPLEPGDEDDPA